MALKNKMVIFDWEVFPEWNCKVWAEYDGNGGYNNMQVITPDSLEDAALINEELKTMNCAGFLDTTDNGLSDMARYIKQLKKVREEYDCSGYNIIQYDLPIDFAACLGYTPYDLYRLSTQIIEENKKSFNYWRAYTFTDLISDLKMGSLKQYESNKGMDIRETTVPFGKYNLTIREKAEIIFYCCHDVRASCILFKDRLGYLTSKLNVSKISDVTPEECWRNTSAKLAAKATLCKLVPSRSTSIYTIPDKLKELAYKEIHPNILENVDNLQITNSWEYVVKYLKNTITLGLGGIHATHKDMLLCRSSETHMLCNADFENLYPGLMVEYGYYPEGMPEAGRALLRNMLATCRKLKGYLRDNAEELRKTEEGTLKYKQLYEERDSLKLVLNALTGAMRSKYSTLYDPNQIIKLCLTGQILTLIVAKKLDSLDSLVIQMNTDGVLFRVERSKLNKVKQVLNELEEICGIPIEFDIVNAVFQKDVNNYILQDNKNRLKLKGRWAKKSGENTPLTPLFAPVINNALIAYYTDGISIEKYVKECTNMLDFCITTKKIQNTEDVIHEYADGTHTVLNKINRVYATNNKALGTLKCVKYDGPDIATSSKIASIPDNCNIYNEEVKLFKEDLDYDWYIKMVEKNLKDMENITV